MTRTLRRNRGQQDEGLPDSGSFVCLPDDHTELFAAHLSVVFGGNLASGFDGVLDTEVAKVNAALSAFEGDPLPQTDRQEIKASRNDGKATVRMKLETLP